MNYKIAGHTVEFPHRAYGVQLGFMDKVLRSLDSSTNALLEAPTGSGKTLSLLCSALAWQTKVKQDSYADMWEQQKAEAKPAEDLEGFRYTGGRTAADKCQSDAPESSSAEVDEEDDCGEVVLHRDKKRKKKTPKIYYATRTHSQIAQVVRELKRTKYRPKMAILASREHYCVHKTVSKKQNKDEECEKLNREEHGCKFKRNVTKLFALQNSHFLQVHDIEDLAKAGRDHKACPYYAARHYAEEAELIFCPYSYLLDPVVRAAMMVDIDGAVLTFDEAHNIEDTCREAASADLELEILSEVYAALQHVNSLGGKPEIYLPLGAAFAKLIGWLRQRADGGDLRPAGFERFEGIVAGHQAMAELKEAGLGQEEVEVLWQLYNEARAEEDKANQQSKAAGQQGGAAAEGAEQAPAAGASVGTGLRVGGLTLGVLSRLLTVLRLMYAAGSEHVRDYRLAIQKWVRHGDGNNNRGKGRNFRRNTNEDGQGEVSGWVVQFCLWSLNPAVAFHEVSEKARSVLLTSGTLAPMATFASELGVAFPTRLEAPHVVDMRRQVWAGAIGSGPDGTVLQATFKHTDTHKFQDSIGKCILQTCQVVPDGVLVFFPSYSLLDKLTTRWKATGLWGQINALKKLVSEPRGTGEAFDGVMTEYYAAIRKGKGAVFLAICRGKGAVFLAICRGKVSEGLDFADGNARAVMIFGIPFPNLKDTKVDLKKKYNDEGSRTKGLLSGDKWYTQQAFRALNQAIGRCIRHRCDYGAIMLIDDRFRNPRFQEHLSRWVKGALAVQPNFNDALQSVTNFFARVTADPPRPPGSAPLGAAAPTSTAAGAPLLGQVPLEPSAAATAATAAAGSGKPAKGSKKGDSKRGVAGESRLKAPGEAQSSQFASAVTPGDWKLGGDDNMWPDDGFGFQELPRMDTVQQQPPASGAGPQQKSPCHGMEGAQQQQGAAAGDASTASQPAEFQPEAWPEDGGGSCSQALNFDDWQPLHQHAGVQDESAARQQQQHARAHMISEHANREATWSVGVTAASALDALIQRWAHEDWQDARLYLQQHEGLDQLTQSDGSLDDVAWRGILECFHFAKERLHDTGSLDPQQAQRDPQHAWVDPDPAGLPEEPDFVPDSPGVPETPPDEFDAHPSSGYGVPTVAADHANGATGVAIPATGSEGRSSGGKRGGASKENAQAQDQQVMKKRYLRSKNAAAAEAIRNKRARAQTGSISSCKAAFYAKTLESDSEDEDDDAFQAGPG
ncbi:hypothetical protein WJX72_006639 [[Myrmecia] bisecta]|uniref:DNA 5'-3' helicase FANCJ n=1 Tax=[Myrmecia] bisecta TaxID=41462 RepID=A0AAW1P6D1_9CHLO